MNYFANHISSLTAVISGGKMVDANKATEAELQAELDKVSFSLFIRQIKNIFFINSLKDLKEGRHVLTCILGE